MPRSRIVKHRRRIKDAIDNFAANNPNATERQIEEGVVKELKGEYKSAFLTLLMPLILQLIRSWIEKRT